MPLGALLELLLEGFLGRLERILGRLGGILGPSWALWGAILALLEAALGPSGAENPRPRTSTQLSWAFRVAGGLGQMPVGTFWDCQNVQKSGKPGTPVMTESARSVAIR